MTINITPEFSVRRIDGQIVATIVDDFAQSVLLTANQAADAAEAFSMMAVLSGCSEDDDDVTAEYDRAASAADKAYQFRKEQANDAV